MLMFRIEYHQGMYRLTVDDQPGQWQAHIETVETPFGGTLGQAPAGNVFYLNRELTPGERRTLMNYEPMRHPWYRRLIMWVRDLLRRMKPSRP